MSLSGRNVKDKLDKNESVTPSELLALAKNFDNSDLEVAKLVYSKLGQGPEDFSSDVASIASKLEIGGEILGDFITVQELQEVFNEPFVDQGFLGLGAGTNEGIRARDKLVITLIAESRQAGFVSREKIIFDNLQEVEAIYKKTAEDKVADELQFTQGNAESQTKNASGVAAALKQALQGTTAPAASQTQQQQADQISDAVAKQCILLSMMPELDKFYDDQISFVKPAVNKPIASLPYDGKILKFMCDPPSHFINNLTAVQDTTRNCTSLPQSDFGYLKKSVVDLRLSFIKKNPNDNTALLELPIIDVSEQEDEAATAVVVSDADRARAVSGESIADVKPEEGTQVSNTDTIESTIKAPSDLTDKLEFDFSINYEGTNPSTARNDVDVTITFKAPELSTFIDTWSYDVEGIKDIKYNIFDLILFPLYDKDAEGYGKAFKSQFSPNYNRLRLSYRARIGDPQGNTAQPKNHEELKEWYNQNTNVLDLSIVDHEFSRDGEEDFYTLKINYRGYVQSLLTTPQTDALGSKEVKLRRAGRELLIKKALDKGCSQAELSKIITDINAASAADVEDVSKDILEALNNRGNVPNQGQKLGLGIYGIGADQLKSDLFEGKSLGLEKVKQFIVTKTPLIDQGTGTTIANSAATASQQNVNQLVDNAETIYFFYLADLLDVILEHADLYQPSATSGAGLATSKPKLKQELKFILGSFNFQKADGVQNINIGHTPISVDFFREWYEETIVQKELFIYPCLSFIRDIFERIATNLLNEVCFKTTEAQRLLVRTSFFTGTRDTVNGAHTDRVQNFYGSTIDDVASSNSTKSVAFISDRDAASFPLIKNEFSNDINNYSNYCVIYVQGSDSVGRAVTSRMVTEFQINNGNVLGEETFSFSRTDQTGLRESRYFRNSTSGISILASVFDTTVMLEVPLLRLYPGNFYLITMYSGASQPTIPIRGQPENLFEQLGLDGYYAITKVSHKIFGKIGSLKLENEISGRWTSSKLPGYEIRRTNLPEQTKITDPTYLTRRDDCNVLVDLASEISILAADRSTRSRSSVTEQSIDSALAIANQPSAGDELTSDAALGGFGTNAERLELLNKASTGGQTGQLTYGSKVITYKTLENDDGTISIIDTTQGSDSVDNIIGVFRNIGQAQTFSENPDYFGGAN